jgi:pyocin large subunit-like protein
LGTIAVPYTRGFKDEVEWEMHFDKHGAEFGAATKEEYLALADEFLGAPLDQNTRDCIRARDGAKVRVNTVTEAIGILRRNGTIATYYSKRNRNKRLYPSVIDYWQEVCRK